MRGRWAAPPSLRRGGADDSRTRTRKTRGHRAPVLKSYPPPPRVQLTHTSKTTQRLTIQRRKAAGRVHQTRGTTFFPKPKLRGNRPPPPKKLS
eukprot:6471092-Alexandrium_andersonii.AAC.1